MRYCVTIEGELRWEEEEEEEMRMAKVLGACCTCSYDIDPIPELHKAPIIWDGEVKDPQLVERVLVRMQQDDVELML